MKTKSPGNYIATTYYQFIGETKLLQKQEKPTQDIPDEEETELDTPIAEHPSTKQSPKDRAKEPEKTDLQKMRESLLEFERILNQID